jgi:UDP-3-O-[3-hydroxymyristoyl] glucosamine N-acyltransferase
MEQWYSLEELAHLTSSSYEGDPLYKVSSVNSLDCASAHDVSFLSNMRYKDMLRSSNAGIVCIHPRDKADINKNFLINDNPSKVFQIITDLLIAQTSSAFTQRHPSAVIHSSAFIDPSVTVGPNTTIDQKVKIGKGTIIHANVAIGPDVQIGENCIIYPGVILRERTQLKNRVILQPGCIIGSCGFGYITSTEGKHQKIEQLGNVILEDDVEIGANTTIDRARFKHTLVSQGTKIDNLVQIGHNVCLGEHNIIVSQTGISGSAKTGKYVVLGGQAGIIGHVEIPDHTQIASRGGVTKSISKPGQYGGFPLQPYSEYNKHRIYIRNIEKYAKKIDELQKKISELEEKLQKMC